MLGKMVLRVPSDLQREAVYHHEHGGGGRGAALRYACRLLCDESLVLHELETEVPERSTHSMYVYVYML